MTERKKKIRTSGRDITDQVYIYGWMDGSCYEPFARFFSHLTEPKKVDATVTTFLTDRQIGVGKGDQYGF